MASDEPRIRVVNVNDPNRVRWPAVSLATIKSLLFSSSAFNSFHISLFPSVHLLSRFVLDIYFRRPRRWGVVRGLRSKEHISCLFLCRWRSQSTLLLTDTRTLAHTHAHIRERTFIFQFICRLYRFGISTKERLRSHWSAERRTRPLLPLCGCHGSLWRDGNVLPLIFIEFFFWVIFIWLSCFYRSYLAIPSVNDVIVFKVCNHY